MSKMNDVVLKCVKDLKPVFWINENKLKFEEYEKISDFKFDDILDAERRLERFAPLIKRLFTETVDGIIESPLVELDNMKKELSTLYHVEIQGKLFLKCDSHLKVAGSIKARGGIYEVLKHAEALAIEAGLLTVEEDYSKLGDSEFREFFSNYSIGVGSTGNLGLSIGIISAALGFKVYVHMSREAKEWKKRLLRERGAVVIEYEEDYTKAVEEGRRLSKEDQKSYFIDDENSKDLFLGYSVAAIRLKEQLENLGIKVDEEHQLYVYLPCGVGGAPGGITFGLKSIYGDNVHPVFVEPTHSPCMLLGLLSRKFSNVHVNDYGLDNITEADGLAVGSPSGMVSMLADKLLDGIYTIEDHELFKLLALLNDSEGIRIEPSAAASLLGPSITRLGDENSIHIAWATGGLFIPDEMYKMMYEKGKNFINKNK